MPIIWKALLDHISRVKSRYFATLEALDFDSRQTNKIYIIDQILKNNFETDWRMEILNFEIAKILMYMHNTIVLIKICSLFEDEFTWNVSPWFQTIDKILTNVLLGRIVQWKLSNFSYTCKEISVPTFKHLQIYLSTCKQQKVLPHLYLQRLQQWKQSYYCLKHLVSWIFFY